MAEQEVAIGRHINYKTKSRQRHDTHYKTKVNNKWTHGKTRSCQFCHRLWLCLVCIPVYLPVYVWTRERDTYLADSELRHYFWRHDFWRRRWKTLKRHRFPPVNLDVPWQQKKENDPIRNKAETTDQSSPWSLSAFCCLSVCFAIALVSLFVSSLSLSLSLYLLSLPSPLSCH